MDTLTAGASTVLSWYWRAVVLYNVGYWGFAAVYTLRKWVSHAVGTGSNPATAGSFAGQVQRRRSSVHVDPTLPEFVNPFVNRTSLAALPQRLKIAVNTLLLVPVKLGLALFALFFAWLCMSLAVVGLGKEALLRPVPQGRRRFQMMAPYAARAMMYALGYFWIDTWGQPAPAQEAPLLVSNHVSIMDAVYFVYGNFPCGFVSRKENLKIPMVGQIMLAMQGIFVDRASSTSRKDTMDAITNRAHSIMRGERPSWPQVLIFPEGTTTNGSAIMSFKTGGFRPGVPVQPAVVRYPQGAVDPSYLYGGPSLPGIVYLLLCQFVNRMEVRYLPVYRPSEAERADPELYAANVRNAMALVLGVPCTQHTFQDVLLQGEAWKQRLPHSEGVVEMGKMTAKYGHSLDTVKAQLHYFATMKNKTGRVTVREFAESLQMDQRSPFVRAVFSMLDRSETGELSFRDYLLGLSLATREGSTEDRIRVAFQVMDVNQDGHISLEEFSPIMLKAYPSITPQEIRDLFFRVDTNHAGYVTFEQFAAFMQLHPGYFALLVKAAAKSELLEAE